MLALSQTVFHRNGQYASLASARLSADFRHSEELTTRKKQSLNSLVCNRLREDVS